MTTPVPPGEIHVSRPADGTPGCVAFRFQYNARAIELLKNAVYPRGDRRFLPHLREWHVGADKAWIAAAALKQSGGFVIRELEPGLLIDVIGSQFFLPPPPKFTHIPPPRPSESTSPVRVFSELLRVVGTVRADAVFKALVRVLHPDAAAGDTELMKALNEARGRR